MKGEGSFILDNVVFVGFEFFIMHNFYYTYYFAQNFTKGGGEQEENIYSQPSNVNVSELKSEKNTVLQLET